MFWILALVTVLLVGANGLQLKLNHDNAAQSDAIERLVEAQQQSLYDNRLASNNGCQRANEQRKRQIRSLLHSRQGNLDRAAAWAVLFDQPLPPAILTFAHKQQRANLDEANRVWRDANAVADTQVSVSVAPQSPNPVKRSETACNRVYPLPGDPGDPLPVPTLP